MRGAAAVVYASLVGQPRAEGLIAAHGENPSSILRVLDVAVLVRRGAATLVDSRRSVAESPEKGHALDRYIVDANTGGIERRGIRIASRKCRRSIAQIGTVRQRKSFQQRLNGGRSVLTRNERGHVRVGDVGLAHSQPFIGPEEEELVLSDGPSQHAAEIVLSQLRPGEALGVGKPVVGIQLVVAEIFEGSAVKGIGP